jgi:hypothetical protein
MRGRVSSLKSGGVPDKPPRCSPKKEATWQSRGMVRHILFAGYRVVFTAIALVYRPQGAVGPPIQCVSVCAASPAIPTLRIPLDRSRRAMNWATTEALRQKSRLWTAVYRLAIFFVIFLAHDFFYSRMFHHPAAIARVINPAGELIRGGSNISPMRPLRTRCAPLTAPAKSVAWR